MRQASLRDLIVRLWNSGSCGSFSPAFLFYRVQTDGGHDAEGLTLESVTRLLDQEALDSWNIATFTFSEILGFYLVLAHKMSRQQVAAAAFSACVVADAARANECDWGLQHDKVMALCAILAGRIELDDFLQFMAYIFGKGGETPIGKGDLNGA